jgi:hypothetical protein
LAWNESAINNLEAGIYNSPGTGRGVNVTQVFVNVNYSITTYPVTDCSDGAAILTNDTNVAFSGTTNWSNITKVVNSTVGSTIKWRVYANDTSNNWNATDVFSYLTTSGGASSCTCTNGSAWTIINGDQCTLTNACNLGANPLRVSNGALRIGPTGTLFTKGCSVDTINGHLAVATPGGRLSCGT